MSLYTLCCCRSLLALRTPERRAPILGEPPHDAAAARGLAFFTLAVVDLERVLEIAEFAVGLAMLAKRCAAGLDRLIEHRMNSRPQPLGVIGRLTFFCCQRRRRSSRRQMRAIERLADVDIA